MFSSSLETGSMPLQRAKHEKVNALIREFVAGAMCTADLRAALRDVGQSVRRRSPACWALLAVFELMFASKLVRDS